MDKMSTSTKWTLWQGSEFYVPNIFRDRIVLNAKGYPDISTWSDLELVNNKAGWESLGIVNSSQQSGTKNDHMGNPYPIQQTIAGVKIDVDSDKFQDWYLSFTRFQLAAMFDAQHKISDILKKTLRSEIWQTVRGIAITMLPRNGEISRLR